MTLRIVDCAVGLLLACSRWLFLREEGDRETVCGGSKLSEGCRIDRLRSRLKVSSSSLYSADGLYGKRNGDSGTCEEQTVENRLMVRSV
jgi:hypothetical protein